MDQHSAALDRAHQHALDWLSFLDERPVPPQASIDQGVTVLNDVESTQVCATLGTDQRGRHRAQSGRCPQAVIGL